MKDLHTSWNYGRFQCHINICDDVLINICKVGEENGEAEHYLPVVLVRPERVGWG